MSATHTDAPTKTRSRTVGPVTTVALVIAVVLIAAVVTFVLQNTDQVSVEFLAWQLDLGLGVAMLIGAAVGAVIAWIISGTVRARRALK
ncbi:lipopolysaccharide assembly LapA domain-containing protein [Williamsia sp.]|uniref:LapA family protein n=1 Tax=Williamsia sp. TaxID=1872085 RepID=UPI001A1D0606|nr:LapA family protein [Williamsia sp.]MBJ7289304.1 LapA family protein [Williamsia sp.]